MIFNSYTFLLFLFCVIVISHLCRSWTIRKTFLLVMSYVFYAAWNPPFVCLLWISTIADWFFARYMNQTRSQRWRKVLLGGSLLVNLGLLGFFKYGTFVMDNFIALLNTFNIDYTPAQPNIILPVGISFYTFQTLSYTFDIYARKAKPWHSFLDYALYVTFFPQLVAGPIVRAVDFLPQCSQPKKASTKQLGWGLTLLVFGLFCKVIIADHFMAPVADKIYLNPQTLTCWEAWKGTLAFSIQIYCDFSGYSTCAIGIAMCLGFVLPDNFRFPYGAVGFSDFWRRWHVSLSTWLRDYLYIPMGGNRKGTFNTYQNLMLTMLLGGLWHGASWTFVFWGGMHGSFLAIERICKSLIPNSDRLNHAVLRLGFWGVTYACVCIAWVFFRASSFEIAWDFISAMFRWTELARVFPIQWKPFNLFLFLFPLLHYLVRNKTIEQLIGKLPWWLVAGLVAVMGSLVLITISGEDDAFIYFQF